MASLEATKTGWRVRWRTRRNAPTQCTSWPDEKRATQAKKLAEAHQHQISADDVYRQILGLPDPASKPAAPTLAAWLDTHLPAKTTLSPATRATYQMYGRRHIIPHLGDLPLDQISGNKIGWWINQLRANGCSEPSITRYFTVVYGAFEAARNERPPLVDENPCKRTDFRRARVSHNALGENEHAVYLTKAEFALLLAQFPARLQPMIDFAVNTGLRWSELSALEIGDLTVDRGSHRVNVLRAWKDNPAGERYRGAPKGGKGRRLSVDADVVAGLAPLLVSKTGRPRGKKELLFTSRSGGVWDYHNFLRSYWRPAVIRAGRCAAHPPADRHAARDGVKARCGDLGGVNERGLPCRAWVVPGVDRCLPHSGPAPEAMSACDCAGVLRKQPTPHDLRHTMAAWLLSAGVQPVVVQRRLGHRKLETTTEIYGGLIPEEVDEAVFKALKRADGDAAVGEAAA